MELSFENLRNQNCICSPAYINIFSSSVEITGHQTVERIRPTYHGMINPNFGSRY